MGRYTGWESVTKADIERRALKQSPQPKASKYKNVKVVVDGEKFDSKKEAAYWVALRMREKAGEIIHLQRQVRFSLYCPVGASCLGESAQVAEYVADFAFYERGSPVQTIVDVKGQKKRACPYPLKKKWLELQEGIVITEV